MAQAKPSHDRQKQKKQRIKAESFVKIAVEQLMGGPQAAAAGALPACCSVKHAARVKAVFCRIKDEKQQGYGNNSGSASQP